jgi:hypothetical protein
VWREGRARYVGRYGIKGDLPPPEMRVHTKSRPPGVRLPNDVPNHQGYSLKFMAKLFGAWIAMLLRR